MIVFDSLFWVWCPPLVFSPVMSPSFLVDDTPKKGFVTTEFPVEDLPLGR